MPELGWVRLFLMCAFCCWWCVRGWGLFQLMQAWLGRDLWSLSVPECSSGSREAFCKFTGWKEHLQWGKTRLEMLMGLVLFKTRVFCYLVNRLFHTQERWWRSQNLSQPSEIPNSHSNKALKNQNKAVFRGVLPLLPWIIVLWRGFQQISALCSTPACFWNSFSSALAQPAHFFLPAVLFMQTDFIICSVYWCLLGAGKPSGELQLGMKFGTDSGLLFNIFLSL